MNFKWVTEEERRNVNNCSNESEANREVGLMLVDSLRELNRNLIDLNNNLIDLRSEEA